MQIEEQQQEEGVRPAADRMSEQAHQRGDVNSSSFVNFLASEGEMGLLMSERDWATTSLGPVSAWPRSLRTAVSICLASQFPMLIWWGPELVMLYNDAYCPILGEKHPISLGQQGQECWPEIWNIIGPMLEGVLTEGKATWSENQLLLLERNGYPEECYFTFSYSPIRDETGSVRGVFTAVTETTQQVLGARRLATLRALATNMALAHTSVEVCTISAQTLADNPADLPFVLLYLLDSDKTGVSLVSVTAFPFGAQGSPPHISRIDQEAAWPLSSVVQTGEPALVEDLMGRFGIDPESLLLEDTPPPHSALVLPIAQAGQPHPYGFLIAGISSRRSLDDDYRGFLTLVAGQIATAYASARTYQDAQERAEALAQLDQAKTLFFSNVSHELRTPLALMLGPIEDTLAEKHVLSLEQRERTEILHRNALRLLKLVNTLLDFSRIEAGRVQAVYEATDLAALTTDLASSFRSIIEKAGIQLIVDHFPLSVPVYVDREMWEKIILNLVSNAFKYTFKGEITVTLEQHETTVDVSVKDTGVGIPPEELPHMFERFHRVKGTVGRTIEGTGIGLSLVHELVKLHGGTISVVSTQGCGSTFTVSLPLGAAHLPQDRIAAPQPIVSPTPNVSFYVNEALRLLAGQEEGDDILPDMSFSFENRQTVNGEQTTRARVLVADDNADMREYVSRLLRHHYSVQTVPDGQAALAAVKESQPDLVLTDIMMPKLDGLELLQALRADLKTSTIPVLLLSARADEEAKIEGMEAGADDYLIKPFSARELLARVGANLEMARIRKEAEQRVHAERRRLYDLFMQAPASVAVLRGPDHVYELANPLYMQLIGKHRDVLGKSVREARPDIAGQGFFELLDTVYQTGEPFIGNEILAHLDRNGDGVLDESYLNFVYQPSYNAKGEIDGILIHAVDVTTQVKARQEIQEREERFRTLAENIPNLTWMATPEGWIYWYNSRWYEYTGTTPEQMEGWGWQRVHDPQVLPSVLERWNHALQSGEPFEMVFPLRGSDGVFHPFLTRVVPIYDSTTGTIVQWFGTNTDITEQKKLEQQKDEFIGIASHELKTPVTSIKGYTQLLERRFRSVGDERSAELLKKMDAQLNKLTTLIRDLLDVTKIESGKMLFHPSLFDFNELVTEIVEETQRTTTKHAIEVKLSAPVTLTADRDRIGQVLINLLTNAIKYSPTTETIKVTTVITNGTVITSVRDDGIGIPKEKQPYIFERFFRVEGETQVTYAGLGLGLYISAEFIKRHHGSIWVESEEGKGTTFSFSLPLAHSHEE